MHSSDILVKFSEVCRSFDEKEVLHNLSFCLNAGEVLALVGPNGAGKTTTVRLLLGLLRCHSGEINVMGSSSWSMPNPIRSQIGVLLERDGLYGDMTGKQNLLYFGQLNGLSRKKADTCIKGALSRVGFGDDLNKMVDKLSKGNRQKITLARAVMTNPKLLILDEPTSALDPLSQRDVRKMIAQLASEKKTALLVTSHNMEEVAHIADRVLVLKGGENIKFKTPYKLIEEQGFVVEVNLKNDERSSDVLSLLEEKGTWNKIEKVSATKILVYAKNDEDFAEAIKVILHRNGFTDISCTKRQLTLEESYCLLMEG